VSKLVKELLKEKILNTALSREIAKRTSGKKKAFSVALEEGKEQGVCWSQES
jgi:hypothetical protein